MKLYIHDKCMEQLFELPKAIQKKVLEFQKKFRENSKSEAIHLEPISTFKDPQLRTARIDQKYRAIIRAPETGDNYYILWVDNHDEAMDWAQNKVFFWNESTETAQIFTSPIDALDTNEPKDAPIKGLFSHLEIEDLISIGVPESLIKLVYSIRDLNQLGEAEKYLPTDVFEHLYYLTEGANIQMIIAEIKEGKTGSLDSESQFHSINNKRNFVEVDDELIADIINGELSKWQIFLHPTQRILVESDFKGSVKVTGGAGTGKTVVALHRLKYLTSLSTNNDHRKTVFTTFTNALTTNLKTLSKKLNIDPTKMIIINIDALVKDLAEKYSLIEKTDRVLDMYNGKKSQDIWEEILENSLSEFDSTFIAQEYQQVILLNDIKNLDQYLKTSRIGRSKPISRKQKMEIWGLIEKYTEQKKQQNYFDRSELFNLVTNHCDELDTKPFRYVIADEIQDLSNVELRFLRSLTEPKNNDLFLVGDPYQTIYTRKINFTAAGISIRGNRSKHLRINYRTSEEIKRLAISAVQGINYDDFDGERETLNGYLSMFHGETPTYTVFRTKAEELDEILKYIKELREGGFQYNDITIGCRTKDALKEVKVTLHKMKIPYNDNSSPTVNDANGVVLSTFHGLKGLEFKAVILSDVNNRTCPLNFPRMDEMEAEEKESYLKSERSLIYVAISRAIKTLRITGTGVKSDVVGV